MSSRSNYEYAAVSSTRSLAPSAPKSDISKSSKNPRARNKSGMQNLTEEMVPIALAEACFEEERQALVRACESLEHRIARPDQQHGEAIARSHSQSIRLKKEIAALQKEIEMRDAAHSKALLDLTEENASFGV